MIRLEKIRRSYIQGDVEHRVLRDIDLSIPSESIVAIVGPSGSGKSTLMNILGLLDTPTCGQYYFEEKLVSNLSEDDAAAIRSRSIGFVFQQFHLLSRLSVIENIILPLVYQYRHEQEMQARGMDMLEAVGLADKASYYPNQLSGGQQQRVAIARALISQPKLILADEPTGALDSKTSDSVMSLFFQLQATSKSTLVVITHDKDVASLCPRRVHIQDGKLHE